MAERKNTPFTGEHFAAWCEKMVGQPYWYGGVVYKCTQNLLDRKSKQYPAHYTSGRMKLLWPRRCGQVKSVVK